MKNIPFWLDSAPPFTGAAAGELPARADVAVIGGGFCGLAAALAMAKKGAKVVVLEKLKVGWGASGRNGGMCTTGLCISFQAAQERYGPDAARRYFLTYNDAIDTVERLVREEQIACHFKRTGRLTVAAKPAHYERLARNHEALAAIGHETRLVPAAELRNEVATDVYHGGLIDPKGSGLHVGIFAQELAGAAVRQGATVFQETEVTGLERLDSQRHRVTTNRGSLEADQVLLASGSGTGPAFPYFKQRIVPIGSFIIATEPLPKGLADELIPHRRMISDTRNLLYYFRITPDERLLFGGRARFALSDPQSDKVSGEILEAGMRRVFPQLAETKIDYCWGGLVDMSQDRMPHCGEHEGLFYAMGFSGHGVQMSTHMGTLMAEVMDGKPEVNPWRDLDWPASPGYQGLPWALPVVGLYYRFLDLVR